VAAIASEGATPWKAYPGWRLRFIPANVSDLLNLTCRETRDEDVYYTYDIFGGLPDCIDDDWIETSPPSKP
jgi:hypothetical protein